MENCFNVTWKFVEGQGFKNKWRFGRNDTKVLPIVTQVTAIGPLGMEHVRTKDDPRSRVS